MAKNIRVTKETSTGRNIGFKNTSTGQNMTRQEFVQQIDQGKHKDYHTRTIGGVRTPASNPDKKTENNLG